MAARKPVAAPAAVPAAPALAPQAATATPQLTLLQGGADASPEPADRATVLERRLAAPIRFAETAIGLAASAAAEQGVDLAAALRAAGWSLGADGLWRLPGHRGGRTQVEAVGAELARSLRSDLAWWDVLQPWTRDTYILRAFGVQVRVAACAAPDLAGALLRLLETVLTRARAGRVCPPASSAQRKLEAIARHGLPPATAPRPPTGAVPEMSPAYLRAFGTATE